MDNIIEMHGVSKIYKDKKAVDNISFNIAKGSITAILGPNGAGKTTALGMLLGLIEPTEGTVELFGHHPKDKAVREKTGAMLQEVSVMDRLKVREIIDLIRSYYPKPMDMEFLIKATGLAPADLNRYAEKLSGGQKRSLGFALALAGNPELIFFDEPTVGLDITSRRRFWETVRGLAEQGKTIVFTTHYLQEAEDIADRILLFSKGHLVADGSPDEIKSRIVKRSVSFLPVGDRSQLRRNLLDLAAIEDCYEKDGRIHVTTEDTDEALKAIFVAGLPVKDVRIDQGRLDEAFEQLTMNQEEAV
ncbi:ABC transporter ATP-binding protein [Paenibacillus sp. FSL R7-0048]|jgi:ABC-2 type transport system ATP-binding protein|uniref:ABC transporter ATP-binding protein n=1 Tax=Paenibacillus odorifer TaxID=189426 RepID=A0ABX3GGN4_9BACL|nr:MULTISPECIES: ABC transporter ATP-binding protein [Paenibacillus]MDH6429377.1 ABC-2 type transport system ATP-binding protein [Paenibacillus sp. PastH-4]MDH6445584.1 ABC-2 type transport system ATP-binding protein [Paenibacillus sp. PastF-4]MDH6529472.1 ABC-2 type transport system ATP-binding protein [Paenibacillus sp. PastH-3]OMC64589.1 ABC transporter ATP-binding protein [Paenibacillus odorifer]OMD17816.1 ABC transporter ATP-binding protein [Paenibacillus odorifer]